MAPTPFETVWQPAEPKSIRPITPGSQAPSILLAFEQASVLACFMNLSASVLTGLVLERIAIWPPLAATAFGESIVRNQRFLRVADPTQGYLSPQSLRELSESAGKDTCSGRSVLIGVSFERRLSSITCELVGSTNSARENCSAVTAEMQVHSLLKRSYSGCSGRSPSFLVRVQAKTFQSEEKVAIEWGRARDSNKSCR